MKKTIHDDQNQEKLRRFGEPIALLVKAGPAFVRVKLPKGLDPSLSQRDLIPYGPEWLTHEAVKVIAVERADLPTDRKGEGSS